VVTGGGGGKEEVGLWKVMDELLQSLSVVRFTVFSRLP
jgi:hypothetical protein